MSGEQRLIDDAVQKGEREGKLEGLRHVVLLLVAKAGITLTEADRARILACYDAETLARWAENVIIGAKSIDDVLS